ARALWIGRATEAAPARHGHQRFEFHLVGELSQRHRVRPGDFQPAIEVRHHAAGVEIGLERAELELARTERWVDLAPVYLMGPWRHPRARRCASGAASGGARGNRSLW